MKFTVAAAFLATVVSASPTKLLSTRNAIARRQAADPAPYGYATLNGGTTGGAAGETVTVSDLDSFTEAAESEEPLTIIVSGAIEGSAKIRVGSDKTIFGEAGSSFTGVGLYVNKVSNVILRNLKIAKVDADNGDAVGIQESTNVWVDHLDISGDLNVGKDDYDGLLDITHAADYVTVSNTYLHDHWKASLVGHSDSNGDEDTGHLTVTYANNYWYNINSRAPSVRYGQVHIVNNYFDSILSTGINARQGAQILVQSTAFANSADEAITFQDSDTTGYVVVDDVDLGGSSNTVPEGTFTPDSLPYDAIEALGSSAVASTVPDQAGQNL